MLRFQKQEQKEKSQFASQIATNVMKEYGNDFDAASDRILAIVGGKRWLERLVLKEMNQQMRRAA